ncbi:hypothetical protein fugu_015151 [Takifugu bimaculatus]|uniref:Uncharacterized protein n=1 Tax=Takifugu bimaculatus TaxID=433685 RepID=A0A4Z2BXT3_9TELE|nr:hypothetical protein fugu_015151 [Takifugu bimaculatus]
MMGDGLRYSHETCLPSAGPALNARTRVERGANERSARAAPNLCNSDCTNAEGRSLSTEVMHSRRRFQIPAAAPCLEPGSSLPVLRLEDGGGLLRR